MVNIDHLFQNTLLLGHLYRRDTYFTPSWSPFSHQPSGMTYLGNCPHWQKIASFHQSHAAGTLIPQIKIQLELDKRWDGILRERLNPGGDQDCKRKGYEGDLRWGGGDSQG